MYPLKGELQDLGRHKGVTVDVKGWGEVMEGLSRRRSSVPFESSWRRRRKFGKLIAEWDSAVLQRGSYGLCEALQRG